MHGKGYDSIVNGFVLFKDLLRVSVSDCISAVCFFCE